MATNISFTLDSPVLGTIVDTYSVSDEDAARILAAYTSLFTPRVLPGLRGMTDALPPTSEEVVHRIAANMWEQLRQETEQFFKRLAAAAAQAQVTPISASLASTVAAPVSVQLPE